MIHYGLAETEISDRLNEKFTELNLADKFLASPIPETEKEAKEFDAKVDKTRISVEYFDSNYESNTALDNYTRQIETVKFRLLFVGKKQRGPGGIFSAIGFAKLFLIGYKLNQTEKLTVSGFGKIQFEPGIWIDFLDFECKVMNTQAFSYDEPLLGGPLKEILKVPEQFTGEFDADEMN